MGSGFRGRGCEMDDGGNRNGVGWGYTTSWVSVTIDLHRYTASWVVFAPAHEFVNQP